MSAGVTAKDLDFVTIDDRLVNGAVAVLEALQQQGLKAVSAESCTCCSWEWGRRRLHTLGQLLTLGR